MSDQARPAIDDLLPVVYDELKRVAAAYMRREQPGRTVQATALVHEAYLRLAREPNPRWQNRAHFCAIAAHAMRQILVEQARARRRLKRAGDRQRVTLVDVAQPDDVDVDLEDLDEALTRLTAMDPELGRLVELRYFGGLSIEEVAAVEEISPATVKRRWSTARAWLKKALTE
ncbi:MAG: sigma-70 family RNA polymerase sigma factor [Acidobacteria bacterium]|nr:sigma-70 family RNA polymerase sigma factor [Acidobacteriota bacterium]